MWGFTNRLTKAISDVTVGTVIVLVHVTLADRQRKKLLPSLAQTHDDPDHVPEHQSY